MYASTGRVQLDLVASTILEDLCAGSSSDTDRKSLSCPLCQHGWALPASHRGRGHTMALARHSGTSHIKDVTLQYFSSTQSLGDEGSLTEVAVFVKAFRDDCKVQTDCKLNLFVSIFCGG